jgi:tubulin polyglutamylase TTLL11
MIFSPKDLMDNKGVTDKEDEKVIQRYIRKPLLINGLKHDLRIYLLIASVEPLVAFINEEGLARFCTQEYEVPTQENKSKGKSVHLTNYSLNKNNPNFVYTNELTEINDGSKQTLSSYWKALEKEGLDVPKIKADITRLNQELLKALKPYLAYFQKCTFPRTEPGKYFHIIGVDIILDSQCNPWILEINASPSMNIDSTIREPIPVEKPAVTNNPLKYRSPEGKTRFAISPVDLHVKSMAVGHAVKLCKKPLEKIMDYEEYDSYTQIYSPEVDEELFADCATFDHLYELFLELSGQRFFPALTPLKFGRIAKVIKDVGTKNLNKIDIDVIYKKTLEFHEQMDLYAFYDAVELLLEKAFEGSLEDVDRRERLDRFVDNFLSMKRPLFFF